MNEARTKPYFEGQASSECGHYYPDVLRVVDKNIDDNWVRILDCIYCGRYNISIARNVATEREKEPTGEELKVTRESE